MTILAAIFVFGILVLVHELGHFIMAKATGMRVDRFAIGFGPRIAAFKKGETEYSIRLLPLGGFNDIAGMDPESNEAGDRGYCAKSIPARMVVILAGVTMNLLLPIFLYFGIFFFSGIEKPVAEPILGRVLVNQPAARAGLQAGDRIVALDGQPIDSWQAFSEKIQASAGQVIAVRYERGQEMQSTEMIPAYNAQEKRAMVGVTVAVTTEKVGFFESIRMAFTRTGSTLAFMLSMLVTIFTGAQTADLAGPIGVAQLAGQVAQFGFVPLLSFTALLSLNLAIINLLPIPALDGGHFFALLIEAVRGKPLPPKALQYAQMVGFSLLILLTLYATKNDIVRLLTGN